MGRAYDATGIEVGGFPLIPDGWWPFEIIEVTEGESKNGDYQVMVDAVCLDARHRDQTVRHWVTFFDKGPDGKAPKGAGMALHFLKCIGEPHEEKFDIDPDSWVGKSFMGKTMINEYNGKRNNKFAEISPLKDDAVKKEDSPF